MLLAAHWDAAFDALVVSFGEAGRAVASPRLGDAARTALGIGTAPELTLAADHQKPLALHRARMAAL